jgi:hypothetical protein
VPVQNGAHLRVYGRSEDPYGRRSKETGFYRLVFGINDDFPASEFPASGVKTYCDLYYDGAQPVVRKNLRMPKPAGWKWVLDDPEDN